MKLKTVFFNLVTKIECFSDLNTKSFMIPINKLKT